MQNVVSVLMYWRKKETRINDSLGVYNNDQFLDLQLIWHGPRGIERESGPRVWISLRKRPRRPNFHFLSGRRRQLERVLMGDYAMSRKIVGLYVIVFNQI